MSKPGVYIDKKKNGTYNYRSSITFRNKHISLGSYKTEAAASKAYTYASKLLISTTDINSYTSKCGLDFEKFVVLINFRDNNVYIRNPIYLQNRFFLYYLDPEHIYKFDIEDLFYYSEHKIIKRNGHLFVSDYGMQVNLKSRYGIKSHAVINRDYRFINDDKYDYRYENIEIINKYKGVQKTTDNGQIVYKAIILIKGNYIIGTYDTEDVAAIAYNKAADLVMRQLPNKKYDLNYLDTLTPSQYADLYTTVQISKKLYDLK